jgi:hypothetical protein
VGGPVVGGIKALAAASTAGAWGTLALGAAAISAWALAWTTNKPAFDDMLDRLRIGSDNAAEADYIRQKRAGLPPGKRAAFDALHPEFAHSDLDDQRRAAGLPTQIHTTVNIDGRAVAKAVTPYLAKDASGPSRGVTGFDPRMTPTPTGATPQ